MKKVTGNNISFECGGQQAGSIFPDLVSLIQRVQTSIRFSELALAAARLDRDEADADYFILDDVTPRYAMANAALHNCRARLSEALHNLPEAGMSGGPSDAHPLGASILCESWSGAN
jgi:hypothetical protein